MKVLIALTFDVDGVEVIPRLLRAIDPPKLPHFDGSARVSVADDAHAVIKFMEEE
jgi:hypothetical protein